uniref:Uncharacterized protein n=1 Tax=Arundo donax TaxID=35708 RepID=A0A0A9FET8_ARUDO
MVNLTLSSLICRQYLLNVLCQLP